MYSCSFWHSELLHSPLSLSFNMRTFRGGEVGVVSARSSKSLSKWAKSCEAHELSSIANISVSIFIALTLR